MSDSIETYRTVTLTDRPPVSIVEQRWPRIGKSRQELTGAILNLVVRRHSDGRALVYGTTTFRDGWETSRDRRAAGVLLQPGDDIAAAVREVAHDLVDEYWDEEVKRDLIPDCLASLPAEDLD
jgi:hypothetical protein